MLKNDDMEHDGEASGSQMPQDQNNPFQLHDGALSANDAKLLSVFVDLQKSWLSEFQCSREKVLVEMTEKLHQEFLSDQQKIRTELLTEFKQELDDVRNTLEQRYRDMINADIMQMDINHRRELSAVKKKQWCWHCEEEAVYFCCWNTSYCSQQCQHDHWRTHRKYCRRRGKGGKEDGAPTDAPKKNSTNGESAAS